MANYNPLDSVLSEQLVNPFADVFLLVFSKA